MKHKGVELIVKRPNIDISGGESGNINENSNNGASNQQRPAPQIYDDISQLITWSSNPLSGNPLNRPSADGSYVKFANRNMDNRVENSCSAHTKVKVSQGNKKENLYYWLFPAAFFNGGERMGFICDYGN